MEKYLADKPHLLDALGLSKKLSTDKPPGTHSRNVTLQSDLDKPDTSENAEAPVLGQDINTTVQISLTEEQDSLPSDPMEDSAQKRLTQ